MNRKTKLILTILGIIIALVLIINIILSNQKQSVGGERDKYGCLGAAGYSYDKSVGACLREWELDESQRKAAKLAIVPLSYPVTIIEVETLTCQGCFNVKLQRNDNQYQYLFQIMLNNWTRIQGCTNYPYSECPENCVVCPSCEYCNSVSCQTEESCKNLGFDRTWNENITKLLNNS